MSDTAPTVDATYRAMLLTRSGEARLRMAGSMYSTARALVVASIREADPSASPAAVRRALFLRFYGHEFDARTREHILVRLDSAGRQPVPVDWDLLELALTWRSGEGTSFLDLRTGEVRQRSSWSDPEDYELSEEEAATGMAEGYLVRIDPIDSSLEWSWMAAFADSVTAPGLREALEAAIHGRRPFRRFKDVLGAHPRERERWFRFHDARLREAVLEWLADHGIEPATVPPATRPADG